MNLIADLQQFLQRHLTAEKIPFDASASTEDLLLLALNHQLKTVSSDPRKVHTSKEFDAKRTQLDKTKQQALTDILTKFSKGDDVNGHLSRESANPHETDALLADWGIYHLHISNHKTHPNDMFFARTGPLMFAQITATDAYFIDIDVHGAWTKQELLNILHRNWPHLLEAHKVMGAVGVSSSPTDLDLKKLRNARINTMLQIGDSVIAPPGGGMMSDGTPTNTVTRAHKTLRLIKALEADVLKRSQQLKRDISVKFGIDESTLDFELYQLQVGGWAVIEKTTRVVVARAVPPVTEARIARVRTSMERILSRVSSQSVSEIARHANVIREFWGKHTGSPKITATDAEINSKGVRWAATPDGLQFFVKECVVDKLDDLVLDRVLAHELVHAYLFASNDENSTKPPTSETIGKVELRVQEILGQWGLAEDVFGVVLYECRGCLSPEQIAHYDKIYKFVKAENA